MDVERLFPAEPSAPHRVLADDDEQSRQRAIEQRSHERKRLRHEVGDGRDLSGHARNSGDRERGVCDADVGALHVADEQPAARMIQALVWRLDDVPMQVFARKDGHGIPPGRQQECEARARFRARLDIASEERGTTGKESRRSRQDPSVASVTVVSLVRGTSAIQARRVVELGIRSVRRPENLVAAAFDDPATAEVFEARGIEAESDALELIDARKLPAHAGARGRRGIDFDRILDRVGLVRLRRRHRCRVVARSPRLHGTLPGRRPQNERDEYRKHTRRRVLQLDTPGAD